MSFNETLIREISILTLHLKEGKIDDTQFARLEHLLQTDRLARQYYIMLVNNDLILKDSEVLRCLDTRRGPNILLELAEYEKTAPSLDIPRLQQQPELIQEVIYPPREKHKISKFNIAFLVLNAAAIVLLIIFLMFAPPRGGVEVATLTDSINAKWADNDSMMRKGSRLADSRKRYVLREGLVEITFDNEAQAVIEAPADFQILADDRIGLTYGKVYATVPPGAIGFAVYTPNTKVIDMGTEFGVEVDFKGTTELSVLKGKTLLVAGKNDKTKMEVGEGTAKKISSITDEISDIQCRRDSFVRAIKSGTNIVWRGQTIDLADIVRNGNGLGTGNSDIRLDYKKGFTKDRRGGETLIAKDYLPIQEHPFIDGIFIPNQKVVISSRGDVFEDFLITSGVYSADLVASPDSGFFIIDGQPRVIQFNGQEYSQRGKSCIVMRNSNHGITFDLDAIRRCYPLRIDRFESKVGLADFENKRSNANFYVLVDGQLRFSLLGYTQKGVLNEVSIRLNDTDRFLTLATTENVDQIDYMANSTLNNNWCVFTEPVLVVE